MIVLGVDAALNKSGLAICRDDVITHTCVTRGSARKSTPEKLVRLYHAVRMNLHINAPDLMVLIERPGSWVRGSSRSKQSTIEALAQARAAAHLAARDAGYRSEEIDVNEARRLIIGKVSGGPGRYTTKDLVRYLLEQRGVDAALINDPDAADAAVIALAGYSLWKAGEYD